MASPFTGVLQFITNGPVRATQLLTGIKTIFSAPVIIEEARLLTVFGMVFSAFIFVLPMIFLAVLVFISVSVATIPPIVMLVIIIRFMTAMAVGEIIIDINAFAFEGVTGAFRVMRFLVSVFLVSMWIMTVASIG